MTEVGNQTQLLLAKMGDEVPALPDRLGTHHDQQRFSTIVQINHFAAIIDSLFGTATIVVGNNPTSGTFTLQTLASTLDASLASNKKAGHGPDLTAFFASHQHGQSSSSALDRLFWLDDLTVLDLFESAKKAKG